MDDKRKLTLLAILSLLFITGYLVWGLNSRNWDYALIRRLPRTLAMIATGAGIGVSTVIFQTITHNRILTPGVMGLDSLYLLVQTGLVFLLGSQHQLVYAKGWNFLVAVGLMILFAMVFFRLLFQGEGRDLFFLLLVGLILGTLFSSFTSFMQMVMDPNEFLTLQNRMLASFNNLDTRLLPLALILLGGAILYTRSFWSRLDVLSLGREQAINLGVDYEAIVYRMLMVIVILVSVATALVGPLAFLGLLTANLARESLGGYQHSKLLLGASLYSILFLSGGQLLVEHIFNFATPLSILINLVGGSYLIRLLLRESVD
ncbi:MAG: iron chelate uptake ABC transporter family permease subunit [Limnochordia bacterium]|jgi:iron complex transport system permease protein